MESSMVCMVRLVASKETYRFRFIARSQNCAMQRLFDALYK